jgi:hypothetical protein
MPVTRAIKAKGIPTGIMLRAISHLVYATAVLGILQASASNHAVENHCNEPKIMNVEFNQVLSDQDLQQIKQAIDLIQAKLPFLVTLSAEERKRLYKMGDKRIAFVQNSLSAAQSNPNILPASFDLNYFNQRYQMAVRLNEVLMRLQQLHEQVDDTVLAMGSEAMTHSLTVYDYVKTAAKKTPGLKGIAEQLGTLFKAIRSKPPKPETSAVVTPN